MTDSFANAVKDVVEVMEFESWLRFYFFHEEGGGLFIRVHEQALKCIRGLHPHLVGLVEELNNKEVDYETSVATVCQFVVRSLDGSKYRAGLVPEVFDSSEFQNEMQLFNLWLQGHEAQLDQHFQDFNTWLELYGKWKSSPEVQDYFQILKENSAPMAAVKSESVH